MSPGKRKKKKKSVLIAISSLQCVSNYSPFMTTAVPMPPANMDGTVMKDSSDNSPIPDKP